MNVPTLFLEQAAHRPEQPALIAPSGLRGSRTVSYAELTGSVDRAAIALGRSGISRGDGVVLLVPVSIELYVALLALLRIGAHAVLVDPSIGKAGLTQRLRLATPKAVVSNWKGRLLVQAIRELRQIGVQLSVGALRDAAPGGLPDPGTIPPETAALLTFTSGSTGQPKGMLRSHAFLLAQDAALRRAIALEPGEVDLVTLPVFVLANLAAGVTSLLADFPFGKPLAARPQRLIAQLSRHPADRAAGSPAFFRRFCSASAPAGELRRIRKIFTGGAPVFPRDLREIGAAFPEARVTVVYGSTEAEPIAEVEAASYLRMLRQPNSRGLPAGRPVPEIRTTILHLDRWPASGEMSSKTFRQATAGPGQPGEILVAGKHVGQSYLRGIGEQENKLRVDGMIWHRTGDAGLLDPDGNLWLLGRVRAVVFRAPGSPLYPFEIERIVQEMAGIQRAALAEWDGMPLVAVEPERSARPDPEAIRQALRPFGVQHYVQLHRLPLDPRHQAKIDYPKLEALLSTCRIQAL